MSDLVDVSGCLVSRAICCCCDIVWLDIVAVADCLVSRDICDCNKDVLFGLFGLERTREEKAEWCLIEEDSVVLVATAVAVAAVVLLGLEIIVAFAIGSLQGDESSIEIDVDIGGVGKNWFCIACNSSNVAANSRRVAILCRLQMARLER